jgi:hypothetical protein
VVAVEIGLTRIEVALTRISGCRTLTRIEVALTRITDCRKLTRMTGTGCLDSPTDSTVLTVLIVLTVQAGLTILTKTAEAILTRVPKNLLTVIVKNGLASIEIVPTRTADYRRLTRSRIGVSRLNCTTDSTKIAKIITGTTTTRVETSRRRTEDRPRVRVNAPQKKKNNDNAARKVTTEDSGSQEMPAGGKRYRHASKCQHRTEKGEAKVGRLISRVSWLQFASAKTFLSSADIPSTTLHREGVCPKAKNVTVSDGSAIC